MSFKSSLVRDDPCFQVTIPKRSYSHRLWLFLGQILIDKTGNNGLNMAALHVAAHMQEDHPFYFQLSEGDKDTFVSTDSSLSLSDESGCS